MRVPRGPLLRYLANYAVCAMPPDPVAIAKALADDSRVRLLLALRGGEVCVCQLIELIALAPSTVSKHLSILRSAGLIDARKDGRWMHYRLAGDDAPRPVRQALAWITESMAKDDRTVEDAKRLRAILKIDPEALCRTQRENSGCCSSAPATPVAVRWRKAGRGRSKTT